MALTAVLLFAPKKWGSPFEKMPVPEAAVGSWEQILHQLSPANKKVLSQDIEADKFFKRSVDHRAIGVVFRPHKLQLGYYVPTIIPGRYDAFVYINKTNALQPIPIAPKTQTAGSIFIGGNKKAF